MYINMFSARVGLLCVLEPIPVTGGKRLCQLWSNPHHSLAAPRKQADSLQCVWMLLQATQGCHSVKRVT